MKNRKWLKMAQKVVTLYENAYPDGCVCARCKKKIKVGMSYLPYGTSCRTRGQTGPRIKCWDCRPRRAA